MCDMPGVKLDLSLKGRLWAMDFWNVLQKRMLGYKSIQRLHDVENLSYYVFYYQLLELLV